MTVYTNGDDERNNKYTDPNDMLQKIQYIHKAINSQKMMK